MSVPPDNSDNPLVLSYEPATINDVFGVTEVAFSEGFSRLSTESLFRWAIEQPFGMTMIVRGQDEHGESVVGVMITFLVRHATAARIAREDEPFDPLDGRHTAGLFLTDEEVGRANAEEGVVLLCPRMFLSSRLSAADRERVQTQMILQFVDCYAGNRVRSILTLLSDPGLIRVALGFGFSIANDFADWAIRREVPANRRPVLVQVFERSDGGRLDLHLYKMLQYRAPILRLPPGAREVLRFAHMGLTDAQIVARHGITSASLNSRWTRIFDIAERRLPLIMEQADGTKSRDRHSVLTYVRNHPEELWPYDPPRT